MKQRIDGSEVMLSEDPTRKFNNALIPRDFQHLMGKNLRRKGKNKKKEEEEKKKKKNLKKTIQI